MKKAVVFVVCFAAFAAFLGAQNIGGGDLTAQQSLKEISVSKMEDSSYWYTSFQGDDGLMQIRTFLGGPNEKEPIEEEQQQGGEEFDKNVLGVKVSFFRRGVMDFAVKPIRPIPIEGITKTISVWIAGRNTSHEIRLLVSDHFGNDAIIPMGKLNFSGWKKITVTIPPVIKQKNQHYNDRVGLLIDGFNVQCNIDETYGSFYMYLDDIRALTDLYPEETRDTDDIVDGW